MWWSVHLEFRQSHSTTHGPEEKANHIRKSSDQLLCSSFPLYYVSQGETWGNKSCTCMEACHTQQGTRKCWSTFFWRPKYPSGYQIFQPPPPKDCMTQVNLLFWCSEMCEAWSQKRLLNNDSRHTTWNGELWLTWIKVQAQHLSEQWQAPIHQEPNKGRLADPFSTTYHSTRWFFNTEQ